MENTLVEFLELCRKDPDMGRAIIEKMQEDKPESSNDPWVIYGMARAYLYKVLQTVLEKSEGKGVFFDDDALDVLEMALRMMKKIEDIKPGFINSIGTDEDRMGEGELDNIGLILERERPGRFQEIYGKTKLHYFTAPSGYNSPVGAIKRIGLLSPANAIDENLKNAIKSVFFECNGVAKSALVGWYCNNAKGRWVMCRLYQDSLEERNEYLDTVYICEDGTVSHIEPESKR